MRYRPFTPLNFKHGFTLAEVLITLVLIGAIATFAIPKILQTSQQNHYYQVAMEDIAALQEAANAHRLSGKQTVNTSAPDIMDYLNHMGRRTTGVTDQLPVNAGTMDCSIGYCYDMPNNTTIFFVKRWGFVNTNNTSAMVFGIDPDNRKTDPTALGKGKSLNIFIYYNGKTGTWGNCLPGTQYYDADTGTTYSLSCTPPIANGDPDWYVSH